MSKSLSVVVSLALATALLVACSQGQSDQKSKQGHKKPAMSVHVARVQPHDVDVYSKFPGRVKGKRQVRVIARVEGILQSQDYTEGRLVHEGDALYQIDPEPFQATVDQRKAKLASDRATLSQAKRSWDRIRRLYKANAVSQSKRDNAQSEFRNARAQIKQDKANLESAQIKLDYTDVDAPLTGVTSLRETDVGSLVSNGTKLTTITQLNPIYVRFALPENDAVARRKAMAERGKESTSDATRQATILLPNGKKFAHKGKVDFTQSTINPQTGTVRLRAIVKNPDNQLMPGRYVRVRLRIQTLSDAPVVPDKVVFSGQSRSYVFVVEDGKAKKQFIKLGPDVDEGRVISEGLTKGDAVVTSGLGQIKQGARIKIAQKSDEKSGKKASGDSNKKSNNDQSAGKPSKKQQASKQARVDTTRANTTSVRSVNRNENYQMAGASNLSRSVAGKKRSS